MTTQVEEPKVSTHSRLKAAGNTFATGWMLIKVSTHSRLKAAGLYFTLFFKSSDCFNTQPPEGGWPSACTGADRPNIVSTHSRLKAAGQITGKAWFQNCCFNTQPPEGGWRATE